MRDTAPNVLVPYVNLHPATLAALHRDGVRPRFVDTSAPEAYYWCLAEAWARGEPFIVLEQDKVPEPGLLRRLWECSCDFCGVATPMRGTDATAGYPSLSCTKFGKRLLARQRDLMRDVGELNLGLGEREWSRLDLAISSLITDPGSLA